jgi:hypothetical protein
MRSCSIDLVQRYSFDGCVTRCRRTSYAISLASRVRRRISPERAMVPCSAGFALASFARLLSEERVSALWVETSNFGLPGGLPAVRRSEGLLREAVIPASVRPAPPSRRDPDGWW